MDSSILSFPARGHDGDSRYPGNCSGKVIEALIEHYQPRFVVDPMEGSGTSRDVCKRLRVDYAGFDLHHGFDATSLPLLKMLERPADLVFLHPPYFNIIRYSGRVWGRQPDERDLSTYEDYEQFASTLSWVLRSCYLALSRGGRLAVLVGDIRRRGHYWSMLPTVVEALPDEALEGVVIKVQHNMASNRKRYTGTFIPISHEYLIVFRQKAGVSVELLPRRLRRAS